MNLYGTPQSLTESQLELMRRLQEIAARDERFMQKIRKVPELSEEDKKFLRDCGIEQFRP